MDGRQLILLYMVKRIDGERSISGCYHMLTGKKSAQSIQDAALYGFTPWFGIFPDWSKASFEQEVCKLVEEGQLILREKQVQLAGYVETGLSKTLANYDFKRRAFIGASQLWTGQEAIAFSKKINLLSQVISHFLARKQSYSPIIPELDTQLTVKQFWQGLDDKLGFIEQLTVNIYSFLEELQDDLLASIVVERFSGYQLHGRTFQQLAHRFNMPEALIHLYYYQVIISLMEYSIRHNLSIKTLIKQEESAESSLTLSAQKTYSLLEKGYSLAEISNVRQLKQNTIEDHLIEIAIHINNYNFSSYLSQQIVEQVVAVSKALKTKKLRQLKEQLPSEISYFQIRLALVLDKRDKSVGRKV